MKTRHLDRAPFYSCIVALAILAGCGGGGGGGASSGLPTTAPSTTPSGAPSPTPSASPGSNGSTPQASQSNVVFQSPTAQQFTVTEANYTGSFTESDTCNPYTGEIAAVSGTSSHGSGSYTITPVAAGTCSVTVTDDTGHSTSVSVSIATAAITVQ